MSDTRLFQYCPKIILFSEDGQSVLLARRRGEQDYDGVYTFIGGKTETTDESLLAGLKREKDEEIGTQATVKICWNTSCYQVLFRKKDGNSMVIPHHVAYYLGGEISLNSQEYDDCQWVPVAKMKDLQPIVSNIPDAVYAAQRLQSILGEGDFETI